ncbi:MAG: Stp1/IreP family PP2C-type Ser/Thr phosphatase [Bacillota bacterium]|nr:Stp1/IreP family PP2C-type Ser/Thr phosphatase [Bacillota bacterium]
MISSVGFKTDKGMLRGGNEDSLFVMPEQNLYIVADGVGGHNSGELASRLAVGYLAQYVALHPIADVKTKRDLKRYFKSCFDGANSLVYEKAIGEPENRGMATTAVLCYIRSGWAYVVNVGDSRAYLIRDGVVRQATEDHTYVNEMVRSGIMTSEEAEKSPDKNMITRAIGGSKNVKPDFFQFEVCPNDVIVLCSDGLYGEVGENKIAELARKTNSMHGLAKNLVDEANKHGGKDNISVICIKIH